MQPNLNMNKRRSLAISGICLISLALLVSCGKKKTVQTETQTPFVFDWSKVKQTSVDLGKGISLDLIWVEPGEFQMGTDYGNPNEKPVHSVKLSKGFWMGKYEITQEQWLAIMDDNPSHFKGAKHPVDSVIYDDCLNFMKRLNEKVPGGGFRLPTEAEYEYACRAGTNTRYSCGDDASRLKDYAWYRDNMMNESAEVGTKRPNPWGFYDLHGNMWEWCQDWFADDYYQKSPLVDPQGPSTGGANPMRVLRGGSWFSIHQDCRSLYRSRYPPADRYNVDGLRVVRTVPQLTTH